jgi:alcohol dehydrogenase class IV
MRYNHAYCVQPLKEIAAAFGDASLPAADQLQALIAELKLPTRISQLSVARERLPIIAQKGLANPFVRANPRPITQALETLEILESAW